MIDKQGNPIQVGQEYVAHRPGGDRLVRIIGTDKGDRYQAARYCEAGTGKTGDIVVQLPYDRFPLTPAPRQTPANSADSPRDSWGLEAMKRRDGFVLELLRQKRAEHEASLAQSGEPLFESSAEMMDSAIADADLLLSKLNETTR